MMVVVIVRMVIGVEVGGDNDNGGDYRRKSQNKRKRKKEGEEGRFWHYLSERKTYKLKCPPFRLPPNQGGGASLHKLVNVSRS